MPAVHTPSRGALLVAWSGATVFVIALAYFLFSYAVTYSEPAPPAARLPAIAVNLALFVAFGLHHSLFARERVRRFVARTVPPHLERSAYVWVASLLLILVCRLWRPVAGVAWHLDGASAWLTYGVQAAGVWLTLRSAGAIDIWDLAGIRQLQVSTARPPATPGDGAEFRTDGPYGWVRHPIYSGWFLIVFGTPSMTATKLVFAIVSSVYVMIAIPLEERTLAGSAPAYRVYMQQVRWRLVPGVY